jgi:hypothetical protein
MKIPFPSSRVFSTTAAFALLVASSFAQAPAPAAPGTAPAVPAATPAPKPLSALEKGFIKNAGKSIYYQGQLAAAAKTAVTDEKLAGLRDTVTLDLNKAWEALTKIAQARGETIAGELQGGDKSSVERLGKQKNDKFVKMWLDELSKESKKLDRAFETGAKSIVDPELKDFVTNYGPAIHNVFTSSEAAEKAFKSGK